MFGKKDSKSESEVPAVTVGRNDPCHCGSGKKYKKCHEEKDEAARHQVLEKKWEQSQKAFDKEKAEEETKANPTNAPAAPHAPAHTTQKVNQPKHTSFVTPKFNMPRKSGGGGA